jgi:peroxiredoxin
MLETKFATIAALAVIGGATVAGGFVRAAEQEKHQLSARRHPTLRWSHSAAARSRFPARRKKGSVVLVVLRGYPGYQCPICTAQVGRLVSDAPQFARAKAQVILVYPGPADSLKKRADQFVQGKALPKNFTLLLDPNYSFTSQYGLRWDAPNETAYPSTFVLDSNRKVTFAKVSRSHGDRANNADILKALPAPPPKRETKM